MLGTHKDINLFETKVELIQEDTSLNVPIYKLNDIREDKYFNRSFKDFESFYSFVKAPKAVKSEKIKEEDKNMLFESDNAVLDCKLTKMNITNHDSRFNPYDDNAGTSLALKYQDFIIVAADTRHSSDSEINSRKTSKIFKINDFLMTITGFYADGYEVYNKLMYQVKMYESKGPMSIHSLANLTSKILYMKRFFPYYAYISLSGFHENKPYVYEFDCIGSYESRNCICNGSGRSLVQPLLDSFIDKKNWHGESPEVTEEYAMGVVIKAFDSASERDVKTGDYLEVYVINVDGMKREIFDLRKD